MSDFHCHDNKKEKRLNRVNFSIISGKDDLDGQPDSMSIAPSEDPEVALRKKIKYGNRIQVGSGRAINSARKIIIIVL